MAEPQKLSLPSGYEDAQPVALKLPPGYEDAKPAVATPSTWDNIKGAISKVWNAEPAGAPSPGTMPTGKLQGLPGVNPHTPTVHEGIQDTMLAASPLAATATIPQLVGGAVGGTAGQYLAKKGAAGLGAGPDTQDVVGDLGGIAGGALGSQVPELPGLLKRGAIGAIRGTGNLVKQAATSDIGKEIGKTASELSGASDPDYVGILSPRMGNIMRAAAKVSKVVDKANLPPPEPTPPPAVQTPAGVAPTPPQAPLAPPPTAPPPSGAIAQAMQAKTAPPVEVAPAAQPPTQPPPSGAIAAAMKKPTIADVGEQIEQGLGGRKLIPNVPLRYQMKPPEPEHMGQFARANGLELHQAIPETPAGDVLRAKIHDLSNVQVRELAIKSGEDMGQQSVSNAKNSGGVPRQEVLSRVLKHHSPEQIGQLIDTLDTKLGSSRGKIAAGMKGKP